ncbi:MAG: hypothetical protein BWY15_02412 [Firmicutes bacterium ADurb.Bin193]|nr:MAG: hypothetical protein BWY15_02412 [Firmicutes bacterium ADurb.Bin193]
MYSNSDLIDVLYYIIVRFGTIDKIHLSKLIYLADKYHLMMYGRTITGDKFVTTKLGPVGSTTFSVLNDNLYVLGEYAEYAKRLLKKNGTYQYVPGDNVPIDQEDIFSETEMEALDFAISNFGGKTMWDVVNYTCNLPEHKRFKYLLDARRIKMGRIEIEDMFISPNDKYFSMSEERLAESLEIFTAGG